MTLHAPALAFLPDGGVRISGERVEGSRLTVQNALVNLLAEAGEDPLYDERGTDILEAASSGFITNVRNAQHAANFASGDLMFFSRAQDRATGGDRLKSVTLGSRIVGGNSLELDSSFEMESGETISFPISTKSQI